MPPERIKSMGCCLKKEQDRGDVYNDLDNGSHDFKEIPGLGTMRLIEKSEMPRAVHRDELPIWGLQALIPKTYKIFQEKDLRPLFGLIYVVDKYKGGRFLKMTYMRKGFTSQEKRDHN